jgi:hypothetical protein
MEQIVKSDNLEKTSPVANRPVPDEGIAEASSAIEAATNQ